MEAIGQRLIRYARKRIEKSWGRGAFEATYLTSRSTIVPEAYLDEDFYAAVFTMVWSVFDAIAEALGEETGVEVAAEVNVVAGEKAVVLLRCGPVVLLRTEIEPYSLVWTNEAAMAAAMERWFKEALQASQPGRMICKVLTALGWELAQEDKRTMWFYREHQVSDPDEPGEVITETESIQIHFHASA